MTSPINSAITPVNSTVNSPERDKLIAQLAEVRSKLRTGIARYREIATQIKAKRLEKENLRGRIRNADERISTHFDSRPRAANYLPSDPDVVAWSKEHDRLEAERRLLRDELAGINSEEFTQEAIAYEGPFGLLAQWQLAEQNVLSALERDEHRSPWSTGEISAVH